ncbi:MAG: sulfur-oxidizing protein SoxB [Pseudohongiellaceae bacterium]|jgi:sulfur-oxidizing protein SoxB
MHLNRREFNQLLTMAVGAGMFTGPVSALAGTTQQDPYAIPKFGNMRLLHFTDTHAQLKPIYFREPNVNLGYGAAFGKAPHLVGRTLTEKFALSKPSLEHAFTYINFTEAALKYGKVGGFAHLKTLIDRLRSEVGIERSLLLDGGDTWQGSGTAYWTRGRDMVGACNLLGVDVMTGHWEFTYQEEEIHNLVEELDAEFIAQNIRVTEEALFDDAKAYDADTGHAFKPYIIKEMDGVRVAVIGQAFPYTPIANPQRFIPNWSFGIRDNDMQELVNDIRTNEKPDAVVMLSHNGMDVDLKMASIVSGVDVILGGHTHDGVPGAIPVKNEGGTTLVTNAGSNGKFLGVMDLNIQNGKIKGYQFKLLPVFSNLLEADKEMASYIESVRQPYIETLSEELAICDDLLYRRGNFNGTFDQVICDAQRAVGDAQISLSPGFRWGTTVLPGQAITMENVMDQTAITYPETYVREMTGAEIKLILEDVCDNLFNLDPYYQQGGDMVRLGGMDYVCDPLAKINYRISNMQLDDGTLIDATKKYKVAGWATVGSQSSGKPIWDVVSEYLRDEKQVKIKKLNQPKLKNVTDNPGFSNV